MITVAEKMISVLRRGMTIVESFVLDFAHSSAVQMNINVQVHLVQMDVNNLLHANPRIKTTAVEYVPIKLAL
jgi:hypothetical protein